MSHLTIYRRSVVVDLLVRSQDIPKLQIIGLQSDLLHK